MAKDEPFYNIKGESSACERIKIIDVDDETSLAISLNEIGQFKSIKVYNEGFVDNQQKRIEELENENNKLLDVINNQDIKITDLEKQIEKETAHRIRIFNKVIELYKALKKENADQKHQLAEAKEIISKLLTRLHNFTYTGLDCEEYKEAEQFIKEIGE